MTDDEKRELIKKIHYDEFEEEFEEEFGDYKIPHVVGDFEVESGSLHFQFNEGDGKDYRTIYINATVKDLAQRILFIGPTDKEKAEELILKEYTELTRVFYIPQFLHIAHKVMGESLYNCFKFLCDRCFDDIYTVYAKRLEMPEETVFKLLYGIASDFIDKNADYISKFTLEGVYYVLEKNNITFIDDCDVTRSYFNLNSEEDTHVAVNYMNAIFLELSPKNKEGRYMYEEANKNYMVIHLKNELKEKSDLVEEEDEHFEKCLNRYREC